MKVWALLLAVCVVGARAENTVATTTFAPNSTSEVDHYVEGDAHDEDDFFGDYLSEDEAYDEVECSECGTTFALNDGIRCSGCSERCTASRG